MAVVLIAGAAIIGARIGKARDRKLRIPAADDIKPRPLVSRILSTLFCVAIMSALVLAAYRRSADLYPLEGAVFLSLFTVGMVAGVLNRRVFGFWI